MSAKEESPFPGEPVLLPNRRAPAYTGIANASSSTIAISEPPAALKELPFDMLEFICQLDNLPYDGGDNSSPGG